VQLEVVATHKGKRFSKENVYTLYLLISHLPSPEIKCSSSLRTVPVTCTGSSRTRSSAHAVWHWEQHPALGAVVRAALGDALGTALGPVLGEELGLAQGDVVGPTLGNAPGSAIGPPRGEALGPELGEPLGAALGEPLGAYFGEPLLVQIY
jgi:hypothetical protein